MAKISSASASDPAVGSARATRQTRSRTESVEPEPAATAGRTSGRGAGDKSNNKSAKQRGKMATTAEVGVLSTVDEDAADEDAPGEDAADEDVDEEAAAAENDAHAPRRISGVSAISGTTAKTSFSQEEAEQLDSDDMIDVLPELAAVSEKLAQILIPNGLKTRPETWKEIRTPGSKHHKQYRNRMTIIDTLKPKFGSQEYIQPRIVLRALLSDPSGMETPAPWRPDNIIFKINLSQMLNSLLIICDANDSTKSTIDALERLDVAFARGIAGPQFHMEAFDFYMLLSAQLTIARVQACIESGSQLPLATQIETMFYDDSGDFKHAAALGFDTIEDESERSLAEQQVDAHVARLKSPFEDEGVGATAANGQLKDLFRWDIFKEHAVRYYLFRSEYLDNSIRNVGGIPVILKRLASEVERRANSKAYEQAKDNIAKPESTPRTSLGGRGGIAALKKRRSEVLLQPPAPVAQMVASADDVDMRDLAGNTQLSTAAAQNIAESSLQEAASDFQGTPDLAEFKAMQRLQVQQTRQNLTPHRQRPRWTDPQPGAVRISAIDDSPSSQQMTNTRGKRTRAEMEDDFDPTQDEGFQTDTRDISGADQRRREVAFAKSNVDPVSGVEYREEMPGPSSSKRQRRNPGSAIPPPTQPPGEYDENLDPGEAYRRAKINAKYDRVTASQAKPSRMRQPWTEEEENALLELVMQHGTEGVSYAALKAIDRDSADEKLSRRSAEDMRFKARNMKATMVKGFRGLDGLPTNWEHVKLDKKAMDQLTALGIEYFQEKTRGV